MTPVQIEVMLHHYYAIGPYPRPCQSVRCAQITLKSFELLWTPDLNKPDVLKTTERGDAYVRMLQEVPIPEKRIETLFIDPRTGEEV